MAETSQDRSEQPTARRKQKARQQGQVPRSPELQSAVVLLIAVLGLRTVGPWMMQRTEERLRLAFQSVETRPLVADAIRPLAMDWMSWTAVTLSPLFVLVVVTAVGAAIAIHGGFVFSPRLATPDLSRIDPLAGAKRLLSSKTSFGLVRDALKVAGVGWVCFVGMREAISVLSAGLDFQLPDLVARANALADSLTLRVALVLLVAGLADYIWQRFQHTKDMRMSKQEVREEVKESEGDPLMKGRIRSRQREMARRRMMDAVPTADVVITNPTHYAVALKYDQGSMAAPKVVAKGQRLIAQRIKQIAIDNDVPLIEDKPLARALYRMAPVGAEIPSELYRAVAEVLGHVYRLKHRNAGPVAASGTPAAANRPSVGGDAR